MFNMESTNKRSRKKVAPCSNCGSRVTMRTGYGWGKIKVLYDANGKQMNIDISKINYNASSVIRCADCKAIRRDLRLPSTTIERT